MSLRKLFLISVGILTLGLPCQAAPGAEPAEAVFEQGNLRIVMIKPADVTLSPGGRAKTVRIQGSGLDGIKKIQLIRGDKMIHNVTGAYRNISRGIGELTLKAASDADLGSDYKLIFVTASTSARPPIQVSVAKPTP